MPFPIEHRFVSSKTDGGDATLVQPGDWNDTHTGVEVLRVASADVTNTTNTYADVTGLTFAIAASEVCSFFFKLIVLSSGTTGIGPQIALNGPASPTALNAMLDYYTSATAKAILSITGYDATAVPANGVASRLPFYVFGTIENGSNAGTVAVRLRRHTTAGTVSVVRGSFGVVYHH